MRQIILASGSIQRKKLMEALDLPLQIIPADIDERKIRDPNPKLQAKLIARAKAEAVAANHPGVVMAADSFVLVKNNILEKPKNLQEAREMVRSLSGKKAIIYTGFCYLDREKDIDFATTVESTFSFRKLTDAEVEIYVQNHPVTTWSGAFSPAYPYGLTLIENLQGSLTGLTHGLPMELVITYLQKSGFKIVPRLFTNS